jgi:hypothetical protein
MHQKQHHDRKAPKRQFAALPCMPGGDGPLVMLVTSRDTGRCVLPKGWAKRRLTGSELAGLEAFEEAGLLGEVAPRSIGFYRYAKRMPDGQDVECDVDVFSMRVATELDDWPERKQRQRRWFTVTEAAASVDEADLASLLLRLRMADVEIPAVRKQSKRRATKLNGT